MPNLRRAFALTLLVLPVLAGSAAAQTLTVGGSCPGTMDFTITGATPGGQVALLTGTEPGSDLVPVGPCTGTELEVSGDIALRTILTADGAGQVSVSPNIPEPACGAILEALDLSSCTTTNAANLSSPQVDSIELTCVPTSNPLRLGCTVTVDPPQPVEVRYLRTDGLGVERANRSDEVSGTHAVPIFFLAQQREYLLTATALGQPDGPSDTATLVTGSAPFDIDSTWDMTGTSTMGLLGGENPCDGGAVAVIYDTDTGELVWYEDIDPSGVLGVLDMVQFTDDQTVLGETGDNIVEVDLTGGTIADFEVDYPGCCNIHHDIYRRGDTYYGFYQDTMAGLTLDAVVALDAQGNELFEWNPRDHLPVPPGAFGDWLHTNSLEIEEDLTMTLSWLTRDSVAKVDMDPTSPTFLDVLWIVDGNPPDALPADITVDFSQVPGANTFSGQHSFHKRTDGRYTLLDNDNGRAVVFTLDDVARTAVADGVYDTREAFCGPQGTARDTEDGNVVVGCLTEFLREYDFASGQLIWEGEIECANGGGGFLGTSSARWYALDGWSDAFLPSAP